VKENLPIVDCKCVNKSKNYKQVSDGDVPTADERLPQETNLSKILYSNNEYP
jgi:hypothetical protein